MGEYVPPPETDSGSRSDTGAPLPEPVGSAPFTLDPGCSLPVTIRFAPTASGEIHEALSIETDSAPDPWECGISEAVHALLPPTAEQDAAFLARRHADPVQLDGSVRSVADAEPAALRLVGNTIAARQYACESGDVIQFDAVIAGVDPSTVTYQWSDAEGASSDPSGRTLWACPWLTGTGGNAYGVGVEVFGASGEHVWASTKVAVYPSGSGLYRPYTAGILPL